MNILILGAKSDVAEAFAYKCAKNGHSLTLAARSTDDLWRVKKDLEIRFNIRVELEKFDACDFDSHKDFYEKLKTKPDAVLCAFGYLGSQPSASRDFSEAMKIVHVNYLGAISILNIIANDFEVKRQGIIAGISSVAGERGRKSNYLYGSAKAGFTAYLSGLRNRLFKSNVHVVTVKPGFINTKMTKGLPLPGPVTAQPEEVAADIYKALMKKQNVVYSKKVWRYIMAVIKAIPEPVFKRLEL
jgi:decaprenylphospho-beta-D-erythro-pentofuranosid-2-ulose 2-reductase